MTPAVLFVYHELPATCLSRLRVLRHVNPGVPLYGIYGGTPENEEQFGEVRGLLDDSWSASGLGSPRWRWLNLDKVIGEWFLARGRDLAWSWLFEHQMDLLCVRPIREILAGLEDDQLLIVDPPRTHTELLWSQWPWVCMGLQDLGQFMRAIEERTGGAVELFGESIAYCAVPRRFVEEYQAYLGDLPGLMEYRMPTCARLLGFRFANGRPRERDTGHLTFSKQPLPTEEIVAQLARPDGARVFHRVPQALEPEDLWPPR